MTWLWNLTAVAEHEGYMVYPQFTVFFMGKMMGAEPIFFGVPYFGQLDMETSVLCK